jgi:hypothetical protein
MADENKGVTYLGMPVILWQSIIASLMTLAITSMQLRTQNLVDKHAATTAAKVDEAAQKVADVKTTLKETVAEQDSKLEGIAKIGQETKQFVNGSMKNQLQLQLDTATAKAEITENPVDLKAAELAQKALDTHVESEKAIEDAGKK